MTATANGTSTPNPLISWREAAKEFGLPASWLKRMLDKGEIPSIRVRGAHHVTRESLEARLRELAGETPTHV